MGNVIARALGLARRDYEAEKLRRLQEFLDNDMNARGLASQHAQAAALALLNDSAADDARSEPHYEEQSSAHSGRLLQRGAIQSL